MIPRYVYIYILINVIFIVFSLQKNYSFKLGPHNELNLYGFLIDNWKKWIFIMIIIIIKNCIIDYFSRLYNNWYTYEIEEKYTKSKKTWYKKSIVELIILNIVDITEWINSIIDYMILRDNNDDLQLLFPNFISKYLISNNYYHYNLMKNRLN